MMDKTLLTNKAHRNSYIAQQTLAGMPQTAIAKDVNLDQSRISQILQKEEIQEIIQKGTADMISLVPKAVEVHEKCLKMISGKNKDPKVAQSSATTVLKTTGIIPSHTAISIDKLLIDARDQSSTAITGLQDFIKWRTGADKPVIDVESKEEVD